MKFSRSVKIFIMALAVIINSICFSEMVSANTSYSVNNGSVYIYSGGDYTVSGTTNCNKIVISAKDTTINLKIENLTIDLTWGLNSPINVIFGNTTVNIILVGNNYLTGSSSYSAIDFPSTSTLNISGAGTLTAIGGKYAAGIGSGSYSSCGNITINSGTVTAAGGLTGAGIGCGDNGSCGNISIKGGTVTATGGLIGAGIGSSAGANCGDITISGGYITAKGGTTSAGIGWSVSKSCGAITISDGTVTATGGDDAAGIGGSLCFNFGKILISGGTVNATGGKDAAGIGCSYGGTDVTITGTYLELLRVSTTKVIATAGSSNAFDIGSNAGSSNGGKLYAYGATLIMTLSGTNAQATIDSCFLSGIGTKLGTCVLSNTTMAYTGSPITPVPTVYNACGKKLTKDTDYTLCYLNNTNTGTAAIMIIGKNVYAQSNKLTVNFQIKKQFKVQFMDGTTLLSEQEVIDGQTVSMPANPTKDDCTFSEWQYADGSVFNNTDIITADTTVYANWTATLPQSMPPAVTDMDTLPLVGGNSTSWDDIEAELQNMPEGASLEIDMNGTTTLPQTALNNIKGRDIDLVLNMGNGSTWTINGMDVSKTVSEDINLGIEFNTDNISDDIINSLASNETDVVQFSLANDGLFGFPSTLTFNLNTATSGLYANLFYYNPETSELEFQQAALINEDGTVNLLLKYTSDYAIIVDDKILDYANTSEETIAEETIESPNTGDNSASFVLFPGISFLILLSFGAIKGKGKKSVSYKDPL